MRFKFFDTFIYLFVISSIPIAFIIPNITYSQYSIYGAEILHTIDLSDLKSGNSTLKEQLSLADEKTNDQEKKSFFEPGEYDYLENQWIKYTIDLNITSDNKFLELFGRASFNEMFAKSELGLDDIEEIEWMQFNIIKVRENKPITTLDFKVVGLDTTVSTGPQIHDDDNQSLFSFNLLLPKNKDIGEIFELADNKFLIKNILQKDYFGDQRYVYELYDKRYELDESKSSVKEFVIESYYDNKTRLLLETKINFKTGSMMLGLLEANVDIKAIDWSFK